MLLDDYQALRTAFSAKRMPALEQGRVQIQSEPFANGPSALARAQSLGVRHGWLQCASRVLAMADGYVPPLPKDGMALQGEWVIDGHASVALRHIGGNCYLLTLWREGEGDEVLVETRSYCADRPLEYRCFYRDLNDGHGPRIVSARLSRCGSKEERE